MKKIQVFCIISVFITLFLYPQSKNELNKQLFEAVKTGNIQQVKRLIVKGADVNAVGDDEATPLIWAAYYGHMEVLKYLVSNGADLNSKDKCQHTALYYAASNGHSEIEKFLIKKCLIPSQKEINRAASELFNNKGLECYEKKEYEDALEFFRKASEAAPEIVTYVNNIGRILIDLNRYDEGEKVLMNALTIFKNPEDLEVIKLRLAEIYSFRGKKFDKNKLYNKAIEDYKRAYEIYKVYDKEQAAVNLNALGDVYRTLHQYDKAKLYYEKSKAILRVADK